MKRTYVKLKWTGPDKGRRVNGRPLRTDEVFEVPTSDASYMLTLPGVEAVEAVDVPAPPSVDETEE